MTVGDWGMVTVGDRGAVPARPLGRGCEQGEVATLCHSLSVTETDQAHVCPAQSLINHGHVTCR